MKKSRIFLDGIINNNSTFVMVLGMCSILAISNNVSSALGMGVGVLTVLIMTNVLISLIRNITPNEIRIPVFIIVIAASVSILEMIMKAFTPTLSSSLGVFLPLITVNCVIMARAEAFASKNSVLDSFIDALGVGVGYLLTIVSIALLREIVGSGHLTFTNPFTGLLVFDITVIPDQYRISIINQNIGAFLVLGLILGGINAVVNAKKEKARKKLEAAKTAAAV